MEKTVPKIRFSEFNGDWRVTKLGKTLTRHSENNKDEEFKLEDILSLSSIFGIVDRKELLEDAYEKVNHLAYSKTRFNDFVYGKSITTNNPFGLFKANKCRDGLLSTLYFTYKVENNTSADYLDSYFSHANRANNFLRKFVLVGDRYITADSNFILSGEIFLPSLQEQVKITNFLKTVNNNINQLKKKKELLEQYKKGVMQKLFSQKLRFKDDNEEDFAEWDDKILGEITFKAGKKNKDNIKYPIYSINNKEGFIPQADQFDGMDSNKRGYDITLYKLIEKNTFAYNPARINVGSIGYSGKLNNVIVSSLYVCFKTIDIVNDYFLLHFFSSQYFNKSVLANVEGGVRQYLFFENFSRIEIYLPSLPEQTKIANFLSAIDDKISHCALQIEKMEGWKKGLLQQMFV